MEKEEKITNVDLQVYELIEKKSHTTTQLSEILEKRPTAISRSIKKLKKLKLVETFSATDKRLRLHVGITVPDINEYR
jgi:predicted transcriptional regulator